MPIEQINVGAVANDGTGDPYRDGMIKVNNNFTFLDSTKATIDSLNALAQVVSGKLDAGGNAVSATKLLNARLINGVAFDGTQNITVYDNSKLPLAGGGTVDGSITARRSGQIDFQTAALQSVSADGDTFISLRSSGASAVALHHPRGLNGTLRIVDTTGGLGTVYASQFSGNAASATKLATPRQINGVNFDGTANITITDGTKAPVLNPTFQGQVLLPEGTAAAPGLTFVNDGAPDTGLFHISDGVFGISCNTVEIMRFNALQIEAKAKIFTQGSNSADNFRMIAGGYGTFWRQDGNNLYLMVTAQNDAWGQWTDARPMAISLATGICNINGNANTANSAAKLTTPRQINGVNFDGTANITVQDNTKLLLTGGTLSNTVNARKNGQAGYLDAGLQSTSISTGDALLTLHAEGASAAILRHTRGGNGMRVEDASNVLASITASSFVGNASSASTAANATQAAKLTTPRQINGVNFDGTANITVYDTSKLSLNGGFVQGRVTAEKSSQTSWGDAALCSQAPTGDALISAHAQGSASAAVWRHKGGGNGWRAEDGGAGLALVAMAGINGGQLAGLRNRLINGAQQVNQTAFNGSWAALAVGQYGYDMWKKADASNKMQVIEDGNYKPSTVHTLSGIGVTTQQLTSPASGVWNIVVPFAANEIMLEEGVEASRYFERLPLPLVLMMCQRYFEPLRGHVSTPAPWSGAYSVARAYFKVTKRATPTVAVSSIVISTNAQNPSIVQITTDGFTFSVQSTAANVTTEFAANYFADARL